MSDTPRTDEIFRKYTSDIDRLDALDDVSRQLERELAAATAQTLEAVGQLQAAQLRIAELEAALKQANSQAEHFEREWYLRGDALEAATARAESAEKSLAKATALASINHYAHEKLRECSERNALQRAAEVVRQEILSPQVSHYVSNKILALILKERT